MAKKEQSRMSLILKGVNAMRTSLREGKITRAIESAISNAEEEALNADDKAMEILQKLEDCEDITAVINEYIELREEQEAWKKTKKYVEELKKVLNEKVTVEEE